MTKNTYTRKNHAQAILNEIALINQRLIASVPVVIGNKTFTAHEALQKISDLRNGLLNLYNIK